MCNVFLNLCRVHTAIGLIAVGMFCTTTFAQTQSQNQADQPRYIPPPPAAEPAQPPADAELMHYDDLPLSIRREFNRPVLSVHVYNTDPDKRYAMVNGFRGREGLPVGQELWIHEIRPDGVLMKIQDQFFLLEP